MKKVVIMLTVLFAAYQANAQEAVDLGLSVKWANMDLEATSPLEKGKKYAWGEAYNAVREAWGGTWRVPNIKEVHQLFKLCKRETTYINDKKYFKFTGPSGNSILFPVMYYANYGNYYWSSSSEEEGNAISFGMNVYESTYQDFSVGQENISISKNLAIRPVMAFASNESSFIGDKEKAARETAKATEIDKLTNSNNIADKRKAAEMYYNGNRYVNKDLQKAFSLYKSLADKGDKPSMSMVAKMYSQGIGTTKDVKKGLEIYAKLAVDGNKEAKDYLVGRKIYFVDEKKAMGQFSDISKIIAKAYNPANCNLKNEWDNLCCMLAAINSNGNAALTLGDFMMENNKIDDAIKWYRYGARSSGYVAPSNAYKLGKIYLDKTFGHLDESEGIFWYSKAAEGGHSQAKKELGMFYKKGIHVKKDKGLAKFYLDD